MGSKVNIIQTSFIKKLSLCIYKTNINAQKIDNNKLETFRMVITSFSIDNKDGKSCFFEDTFLLADISIDISFGMLFLTLSNIEINFNNEELK